MAEKTKGGLADWLTGVCQEAGLTSLRQTSLKTGLSHATIADILSGNRPSPETIRKLAGTLSHDGINEKIALEDHLLVMAGYRTPRPEGEEPSPLLSRLMDTLAQFDDPQIRLVAHFAEFLSKMEVKGK